MFLPKKGLTRYGGCGPRLGPATTLVVFVLAGPPAAAADGISTDRPDVAESSETVGHLRLQIETGVDLQTTAIAAGRVTSFRIPTKVRFGLLAWAELHVESGWLAYDHLSGNGASDGDAGLDDVDVGGKVHFLDGGGVLPSMGVLLALTLPVGSEPHSGEAFLLSPTVAADWAMGQSWGLGVNAGVTLALDERDQVDDSFRFAVAIGRTWSPLTDRLRTFVELFGETALASGATTALSADGGFTWLASPLIQLDVTLRVGISESAPDFGGGLGASIKI